MRRIGMEYGAKNAMARASTRTKAATDAYTAGVNSYIDQLENRDLPIEYQLLNYKPERWTNLKTYLFLMYMQL